MDWLLTAAIAATIYFLSLLLGGPDATFQNAPCSKQKPVQADCQDQTEEPAAPRDARRLSPVGDAVLPSATGNPDP